MIQTIDVDYVRPGLACCHLLVDGDQAAFMDTGTSRSIPRLLAALEAQGLGPECVRYVCPTHVHLDHAGGAGQLMALCPNARCVVHPRGARHLIDPSRLIEGSRAVYGQAVLDQLYGEILPIDEDRMIVVEDGARLRLDRLELEFVHTEGHARHHYCAIELDRGHIFTGDTLGISYRDFDTGQGAFVFATTTPVQFDPAAWRQSIQRLENYRLETACLTHFGQVGEVPSLMAQLSRSLDDFEALALSLADSPRRTEAMSEALLDLLCRRLDEHGDGHTRAERETLLHMDVWLNVMGMEVWLDRRAAHD